MHVIGQRWVSDTESELGLGKIIDVDHRFVSIFFSASEETRTYAIDNAPLSRVRFAVGDSIICDNDEQFIVTEVLEESGLLTYQAQCVENKAYTVSEERLSPFIQFSKPQDRLFTGKVDKDRWFQLRFLTQKLHARQTQTDVFGLSGARATLIKHQLYIAHEVACRHAPRVLLADEVGLGKTIEAGLILHQQLLTERAKRILIIVPESLCFQWLVEMYRRFNLSFSLFDEERCMDFDLDEESLELAENPFLSEQLVLCSLQFLVENPERQAALLTGEWDMLVVDEAHHLQWSEHESSAEYSIIEALAEQVPSILLLTATPEQLGRASHFARLRLLDSDRFYSLDNFIKEEEAYAPIAVLAESLVQQQTLSTEQQQTLLSVLGDAYKPTLQQLLDANEAQQSQAREAIITALLDRHGTGRALFRNTRKTVAGFPERKVFGYPLTLPAEYYFNEGSPIQDFLYPEQSVNHAWCTNDSRLPWLCELLTQLKTSKVLLICTSAETVLDLEQYLWHQMSIRCAVFHEGMSIVQRDRSAAYFAEDTNHSAQVLLCSEIGSEGRNFQFAHHLILFDLPLNPDLLEQRIGRLDRIGQTETIQIHVPYFENTAQQLLFQWYNESLGAFTLTCPVGQAVYTEMGDELKILLTAFNYDTSQADDFIQRSAALCQQLKLALQKGRDCLLELSSCRQSVAAEVLAAIETQENTEVLKGFMQWSCDQYGIDFELHSEHCFIIRPGSHMLVSELPWLPDDGVTITFDRNKALEREDILFLTWEHPLVIALMEQILNDERGNTSVLLMNGKGLPLKHQILVELIFIVECAAPKALQIARFMPTTTLRMVLDPALKDHAESLSHQQINSLGLKKPLKAMEKKTLVDSQKGFVTLLLKQAEQRAAKALNAQKNTAIEKMTQVMQAEIQRMQSLQQVNPNIRDEEIEFLKISAEDMHMHIQQATPKLDALRLIFVSK